MEVAMIFAFALESLPTGCPSTHHGLDKESFFCEQLFRKRNKLNMENNLNTIAEVYFSC